MFEFEFECGSSYIAIALQGQGGTKPSLMQLSHCVLATQTQVCDTPSFERAGHVKASACAAVSFLACHPIGAKGDDCMVGPYRTKLLEAGAFGVLLRAALTSVLDEQCDMIVQQVSLLVPASVCYFCLPLVSPAVIMSVGNRQR